MKILIPLIFWNVLGQISADITSSREDSMNFTDKNFANKIERAKISSIFSHIDKYIESSKHNDKTSSIYSLGHKIYKTFKRFNQNNFWNSENGKLFIDPNFSEKIGLNFGRDYSNGSNESDLGKVLFSYQFEKVKNKVENLNSKNNDIQFPINERINSLFILSSTNSYLRKYFPINKIQLSNFNDSQTLLIKINNNELKFEIIENKFQKKLIPSKIYLFENYSDLKNFFQAENKMKRFYSIFYPNPGAVPSLGEDRGKGLSIFIIIILLALIMFVIYCVLGIFYNAIVMNKPFGYALLPNSNFWIKVIKMDKDAEVVDQTKIIYGEEVEEDGEGYFGINV